MRASRSFLAVLLALAVLPGVPRAQAQTSPAAPATVPATPPQEVKVGVYLHNVESLNLADNTYYLDFVLWFRWRGPLDPTKTFRLMNVRDTWGLTVSRDDEAPITLPDGSRYQSFRVEGRFYHKFWLGAFPLDWQKAVVEIEDREYNRSRLRFIPDLDATYAPALSVPGWVIHDAGGTERVAPYPTTFGLGSEWGSQEFSQYRYAVTFFRPPTFFMFRLLPPILLVLLSAFTVFYLRPDYVDARLGTVVGSLLAEVFLYLTFTSTLPALGTLTLLDHIFNIAYLTLFLMLVVCVVVTRRFNRATELAGRLAADCPADERPALEAQERALRGSIELLEARARWCFPVAFVAACLLAVCLVRGTVLLDFRAHF